MRKGGNKINWRGTPEERFFRFVDKTFSCWLWNGAMYKDGYGEFMLNSYPIRAHRYSFLLHKGPIPKGRIVCHSCDVRNCVNPNHLWVGTHSQNTKDMHRKGRAGNNRGEKSGTSKLRWSDIHKIRDMEPYYSQADIAKVFNVTQSNISAIIRKRTWV